MTSFRELPKLHYSKDKTYLIDCIRRRLTHALNEPSHSHDRHLLLLGGLLTRLPDKDGLKTFLLRRLYTNIKTPSQVYLSRLIFHNESLYEKLSKFSLSVEQYEFLDERNIGEGKVKALIKAAEEESSGALFFLRARKILRYSGHRRSHPEQSQVEKNRGDLHRVIHHHLLALGVTKEDIETLKNLAVKALWEQLPISQMLALCEKLGLESGLMYLLINNVRR
jgi:hypothetical protein